MKRLKLEKLLVAAVTEPLNNRLRILKQDHLVEAQAATLLALMDIIEMQKNLMRVQSL